MGSCCKSIHLILVLLKIPFLVQNFSCYTLITFLMMVSVILLSKLMMLLSSTTVITVLICCKNLSWLLNLNLICKTLERGRKCPVNFTSRKNELVSIDYSRNFLTIYVKIYVFTLLPTAKIASKKICTLILYVFLLRFCFISVNLASQLA